jgi:hypothetical protein
MVSVFQKVEAYSARFYRYTYFITNDVGLFWHADK